MRVWRKWLCRRPTVTPIGVRSQICAKKGWWGTGGALGGTKAVEPTRRRRAATLAAASLAVVTAGSGLDLCLYGCPEEPVPTGEIVVRSIYVLSSDPQTKFASWVAYRVTASSIGPTAARKWKADPALAEADTLEPDDYDHANAVIGTDRGHQAPLASFTGTRHWESTNLLSNITPQLSALNQGPWRKLEEAVRSLAKIRDGTGVYVVTGPLFEREMPTLPAADEDHQIPSGYWKVIAVEDEGDVRAIAFAFDQETRRRASHCQEDHRVTIQEIEWRTSLDLFPLLSTADQVAMETAGSVDLFVELGCGPEPEQ